MTLIKLHNLFFAGIFIIFPVGSALADDDPRDAAEYYKLLHEGTRGASDLANPIGRAIAAMENLRAAAGSAVAAARPRATPGMQTFTAAEAGTADDYPTVAGVPVGQIRPSGIAPAAAPAAPTPSSIPSSESARGLLELRLESLDPLEPTTTPASVSPPGPGGIAPARWNWLGPGNIGGRTRAVVVHPTRPEIMWLGAVAGGIWKTFDGGKSWAPLADFMASLNVSALMLDPEDPNTLFAGTGEGYYNLDAFRGAGLFRSKDGGASWEQVDATATHDYDYINRITTTAGALLIATRTGVYRSTNFRSPISQITFQPVTLLRNRDVLEVVCSPRNQSNCVASGRGRTVYYSIDGGVNWDLSSGLPNSNPAENFEGRVEVTYAAADPAVIYASVDRNLGEIYRSSDSGRTFTLRNSGAHYLSQQGWYGNAIWAGDPTRPDLVVVGGMDLYRSIDGGQTLTKISDWRLSPASAHADHHAIVSHPGYNGTSNRIVFFGNDGGIYRNNDILTAGPRSGWVALNNGYGATQFYGGAGNLTSGRIVAGAQDNGTLVYVPPPGANTGPNGYSAMYGGDGGFVAADPTDPNMMYGEYVYLQIHRSVDGGSRSFPISGGIEDAGRSDRALFIAPFILDPANPETMLAGGASLWRSPNVTAPTPAWTEIKGPLQTEGGMAPLISAVEGRQINPGIGSDLIYVGYTSGDIYFTTQGLSDNPAWTSIRDISRSAIPQRFITRIRVDPKNTNVAYLCFTGYSKGNLWKTIDGGQTWSDVSGGMPELPVYDVAIHPQNSNFLYAATEVGIFASADAGNTWWPTNEGPANVAVNELFWMGQRLISMTHGRGIFWIDLTNVEPTVSSNPQALEPASLPVSSGEQTRGRGSARTGIFPVSPLNTQ
jgi:photosystem II stability/assembly factor-like uncharacterized protein